MNYYLAIDIGASSGRHIIGYKENGEIITKEIYRFTNGVKQEDGHLIWDIDKLFLEVKEGIKIAFSQYDVTSLSIDSWGVDYVLLDNDKEIMPVYAYRDNRTEEIIEEVHKLVDFATLYQHTGCQFQTFNSLYQLYADKKAGRLNNATDFLMIPEYLMYKLTGVKSKEFTNATTTGLINSKTLQFDNYIIEKLNLPTHLFKPLNAPKTILGTLKQTVAQEVNGNCQVVLCATHDTGSAVEGIEMDGNDLYISSGTWSLLGVKTDKPICEVLSQQANYSNEGGINYNRYQKNIMGMWLVNELKKELCPDDDFSLIVQKAQQSSFLETVDANDQCFLAPVSMKKAFDEKLINKPANIYDYFNCAYRSLALSYKQAIEELEKNIGSHYERLYIVGGGAKNTYLNELTEKLTGKKVIALPIEATSVGNLKVQMEVIYEG